MTSTLYGQLTARVCVISVQLQVIFLLLMSIDCIRFYFLLQGHLDQQCNFPN